MARVPQVRRLVPATATTTSAIVLQATGVVPDDVVLERYLNVYALPEAVVAACPTTYQGALQIRAVRA
jgi:hypothetical protein